MTTTPQPEENGAVRRLLRLLADPDIQDPPVAALAALHDQLAAAAREEIADPYAAAAAALAALAQAAASAEGGDEALGRLAGGLIVFTEVARAWPHGRTPWSRGDQGVTG